MALQDEIQERINRCAAGVPWVLRGNLAGRQLQADEVSTDELVRGVQILVLELARVVVELAGEIDKLRSTE